ncbi:putative pyrroloquinoline-quinone binding quinoprotein [Krasilnikovia cinnamomea]|uniref:Putative pyrroloquinoline-quinone binding quinoprotein n=1 Tax=Krasilnikovia cinnamomea TaxID=349313 RepID=A0A4Q7ZIB7_9ACTN|nr:PQQ-binding-like beta-propeller repeat protein [Krasilnikovia cinnamomea]RZU49945.1 putative pyrroloquinoline-quinone binding quinoprotein [Krasilnikovia cinnamomea]
MAVIELGYVGSGGAELPEPPPLRPAEWGRRHLRRLTAALLAVLCLVTVTASDHLPAPRGLQARWEILFFQGDMFTLARDTVVVLSSGATQRLTGYDLDRGTPRWSREMDQPVPYLITTPGSSVVLLPTVERSVPSTPDGSQMQSIFTQTVAIDAATGAQLWRAPGDVTAVSLAHLPIGGDRVLLADHAADSTAVTGVRLVGARDGREVWRRDTPGAQQIATIGPDPRRPDRVATVTGAGQVRLLRLSDGAELGGGTVSVPSTGSAPDRYVNLGWHGGQLTVTQTTDTGVTVTGYGGQPLRQRWRVDEPDAVAAYGCGPVWCISTGAALIGRDWDSGLERWRAPLSHSARPFGADMLAVEGTADARYAILDAGTGRSIARLDGEPVEDVAGTRVLTISPTVTPGGRSAVGRVDLRTGETFTLGTIDGVSDYGCLTDRGLLVCQSVHDRLTVSAVG